MAIDPNPIMEGKDTHYTDPYIYDEAEFNLIERKKGTKFVGLNAFGLKSRHIHIDYHLRSAQVICIKKQV